MASSFPGLRVVLGAAGVLEALKKETRSWLIAWASLGGAAILFALFLGIMAGHGLMMAKATTSPDVPEQAVTRR